MPCLPLSSPPPGGPPAEKLDDPMPKEQKNANFQRLLQRQNQISGEKHQAYVGKTLRCLVDGQGRTAASPPAPPGGGWSTWRRSPASSAPGRKCGSPAPPLGRCLGNWRPGEGSRGALRGPSGRGPPSLVGGPVGTVAGWALRRGFPPGPGRECMVLRTLRVVGALPVPRGAAPGGPPARRGSPFLPRNGEKEGRGASPWTPSFMARSFPLAGFGGCTALFRWWGYYGAHVRALIWIRILREQGLGAKAFCCRGIPPAEGFPLGGKLSPEVTDEGRPGCPTEQKKNAVEATAGRLSLFYKERLGTGSPPHPPQCAHWATFPQRGRLWSGKSCRVSHPLPSNGLARQGTPRRVSPPAGGERK